MKEISLSIAHVFGGGKVHVLEIEDGVEVCLLINNHEVKCVKCRVVISNDVEVLLSDALIEELGIIIEVPKSGIWRCRYDPENKIRQSVSPKFWE